MTRAVALAVIVLIFAAMAVGSWAFPPLGIMACLICGVTAIIDMMMNGSRDAGWAPWGIGIAALTGIAAGFGMP